MSEKVKHKIGMFSSIAMIVVALFFDLLSLIPFLNIIIALVAWCIFFLWFFLMGTSFDKHPETLAIAGGCFVFGLIPFFSALPEITAGIVANLLIIRIREKTPTQS